MPASESNVVWFLRITAIVLLSAALGVVLPDAWMNAVHEWAGLGELPELPMVGYLARSVSLLYATMGAYCWVLSYDVRRYLPFLRHAVWIAFGMSVTLIAIALATGIPGWWTFIESAFVLGWTIVFGWLVRRVES